MIRIAGTSIIQAPCCSAVGDMTALQHGAWMIEVPAMRIKVVAFLGGGSLVRLEDELGPHPLAPHNRQPALGYSRRCLG